MKILGISLVALSAVVLVGCGQKPKLPEGTVAAAYVDLQKVYASGKDVAEMVIDKLPKTIKMDGHEVAVREEADKNYKEGLKMLEETLKGQNRKAEDFKWILVSVGDVDQAVENDREPTLSIACRIEGLEKVPEFLSPCNKTIGGEAAYEGMMPFSYVVLYKQCLLAASTENALEKLVQTYKGDKPAADGFNGLMDLGENAVARVQVAGLADFFKIVKISVPSGGKKTIAEALKDAFQGIDEEMGEYLAEVEGVTFDLNLAEDDLGFAFSVVCGSGDAAELVEQALGTVAILARLGADSLAVAMREGTTQFLRMLPYEARQFVNDDGIKAVRDSGLMSTIVKAVSNLGKNVKVERDGRVAGIGLSIPLDDIAEDVIDGAVKASAKLSEK